MKTSELKGMALCYTVCMLEMPHLVWGKTIGIHHASEQIVVPELPNPDCFSPFMNWAQCGPIIEENSITLIRCDDDYVVDKQGFTTPKRIPVWAAEHGGQHGTQESYNGYGEPCGEVYEMTESECSYGPTPLIAAMRCYVASKLGDEVEIPEELS